jgi:hypothetical protein
LLAVPVVACHSADQTSEGPAFPFDLPQVADNGGPKLTSVNIVVFIAPTDPNKPEVSAALDYLRTSSYWNDTTSEYGIGPIADIRIEDPPTAFRSTITEHDIADLIGTYARDTRFGGASNDAGAPMDAGAGDGGAGDGGAASQPPGDLHTDTLYAVVLPATTRVLALSCGVGGEHGSVRATATDVVPYAFTRAECMMSTLSASQALVHEIVEAATDPFSDKPAVIYATDHAAWGAAHVDELADLCVGIRAQLDENPPTLVQGTSTTALVFPTVWSNRLAALGRDPCVPDSRNAPRAFAMALPVLTDTVQLFPNEAAPGVVVGLNDTVTIQVRVSCDRPVDYIDVFAADLASSFGERQEILGTFDRTSAKNGDVLQLSITRSNLPASQPGILGSVMALVARTPDGTSVENFFAVGVPPK